MKKVKKFGRGGDIITGLGAVLVGKALYDKYKEGKGKDDESDYAKKVREFGTKGRFPEEKTEEKAAPKKSETPIQDTDERIRANKASKGRPEMGDATNDNIVVKEDAPTVKKDASAKKTRVIKKAASLSSDKRANNKSADNKTASDIRSSVVFKRASEPRDESPAPTPPVSRYVRPPDVIGQATEKKIESNKAATKDRPSQAFPYNKAADEKAIQKAGGVRVDNKLPKGIDTKTGNKTAYGTDTTSVFQKRAAQEKEQKAAKEREAAEAAKKRKPMSEIRYDEMGNAYKRGGAVKASKMGSVKTAKPTMRSASKRADGIAIRGKTRA